MRFKVTLKKKGKEFDEVVIANNKNDAIKIALRNKIIFMRFKVTLKKKGKEFDEIVIANNKYDAIEVALKNNPESEAINSDWTFKL